MADMIALEALARASSRENAASTRVCPACPQCGERARVRFTVTTPHGQYCFCEQCSHVAQPPRAWCSRRHRSAPHPRMPFRNAGARGPGWREEEGASAPFAMSTPWNFRSGRPRLPIPSFCYPCYPGGFMASPADSNYVLDRLCRTHR
jgi:hypothetical protein